VPARRPCGHIILWWWSSQLRWPVALLALLGPRLVGRRLLRPVLHPRADGLDRPLTMATATALIPVMRAAATMGSSNLMGTSTTPGQATTSRVPASHAPCLILLSLIGAFSGKPSGLFHRQTRCPGSRHRQSTSRARPACLVHARRAWLRNSLAASIGSAAEHAAPPPSLTLDPTPDDPRHARTGGSHKAAAAEGIGLVTRTTGPR
jgi:hypothetical protein